MNTRFTAGLRDVHCVFQKNHRIIVSESDAAAAVCICGFGNHFRRSAFGEKVKFSGFADVPVLTKFTGEITSSGTEGQHRRSRKEMIQRFFFNRINAKSAGSAVSRQQNLFIFCLTHKTKSTLAFTQLTQAWADVTLNPSIIQFRPVTPGMIHTFLFRSYLVRTLDKQSI